MRRFLITPRTLTWLGAATLFALTIFAYWPAWHGGFIWDDDRYVIHNYLLIAPDGLRRIWFSLDAPSQYFPLTYTVLRIERSLWDLNPAGYHWVNILLHLGNALLVWCILARLKVPGAWLAATIFALHPVQVESVAWISELKNVLMGFFFLLTLLTWIAYADAKDKHRRILYAAALVFYLLALCAKSTACTLPAALLLVLWLKKKSIERRALLEIIPFVVLALGIGLVAVWWEKYHQGTRMLVSLGPVERLLIASRAVWFYLGKIFWPAKLTFIYPQWRIDPTNPIAYLWPIALASAGLVTLSRSSKTLQRPVVAGCFAILGFLSVLTSRQSATYHDLERLWRTTIAKNPGCWMAYNNLGVVQFEKGSIEDAIEKYQQSLSLHPDYPEAHYNLGSALLQKGYADEAIRQCEEALKIQ